ncbi:MAG: hypothetical protein G01um101491_366, partial [Parcubacteria group bacterium Gr01-1014_91]
MTRDVIPADELYTKARAVGQYYGFTPLVSLTVKKRGEGRAKSGMPDALASLSLDPVSEVVVGFLKHCQNAQCAPTPRQPLFLWHTNLA